MRPTGAVSSNDATCIRRVEENTEVLAVRNKL